MALSATAQHTYGTYFHKYETDLCDKAWRLISQMLPADHKMGRPREVCLRSVVSAIFYVLKTGCPWRFLPTDFPAWSTVYRYFHRWIRGGVIDTIHDLLRSFVRIKHSKNPEPTIAIIDSQTVKTSAQAIDDIGYDGGKKTHGRKRHIAVDSNGLLLGLVVHAADIQDRDGAGLLFGYMQDKYPLLDIIYADGGYQGPRAAASAPARLVVIKRTEPGFKVLPKRWIVERTFAWFTQNRRLSKDYEAYAVTSEAFIKLAMIRLMLERIFG